MKAADVMLIVVGATILWIVFSFTRSEWEACRKRHGELVRGAWGFACVAGARE